jgi:parallel beta-helix repeat protein
VKLTKTLFLMLFLIVGLFLTPVLPVQGSGIIFIQADGSIEGTNKIYRSGNVFTFTGNIEDSYGIIVNASNIILDGKGHTLKSVPRILPVGAWDSGIELAKITSGHVTIKNLNIVGFNIGVCVYTTNNTVEGNKITGSNMGILIAESPNTVVGNHIENNIEGIFMGPLPDTHETVYNVLYHNSFVNNTRQVYDCECTDPHTIQHLNIWDNGTSGNYWSDYTGTDADKDGIGDAPYQVSSDDVDTYPLMAPIASPLNKNDGFLGTSIPMELGLAITAGAVIAISAIVYMLFKRKKSRRNKK